MVKGYFAAQDSKETASAVLSKTKYWTDALQTTKYLDKCRNSWKAYNGMFYTGQNNLASGHQLSFGGDQGEFVQMAVNHYRNLATHMLNLTTSNRPALEALATNTDSKSLSQAILANDLLDYYVTEKKLEDYFKRAAEYAIVMGEGYVKVEWNSTAGEVYEYNEELGVPVHEGDLKFSNHSIFDVIRDTNREDNDHDWIVVRNDALRWDLIAKYPEFESQILAVPAKNEGVQSIYSRTSMNDQTDLISVYEFFHKRSDALPEGRYMIIVSPEAVLHDGPLPYRNIPVYRMSASDVIGTPLGYTPMFDLMPIQEAINGLYSTIITNQNAFGVQNIMLPKGSNISTSSLTGGLNVIEYDPALGAPSALNLTKTPAELFQFLDQLKSDMELISGINSVARGNPEPSLRSGNALALIQAQAIQFASGLQHSYVRLQEDVGTAIIKILQDYADVPRVAVIAGKAKRSYIREFKGEDLLAVNRVKIKISNPLARTAAGRSEMANNLLQMGLIKTPQQYFMVMQTGALDVMLEGDQAELLSIKQENEYLADGKSVPVIATDNHQMHINEHKAVIADPEMRNNPEIVARVLEHMNEHIQALKTVDPDLLMLLGQQPIQQAPQGPQAPQGGPMNQQEANSQSEVMTPPDGGVAEAQGIAAPQMPTPPGQFQDMPMTPQENLENMQG